MELTQSQAQTLIEMPKHRVNDESVLFPPNQALTVELRSEDRHENFQLDVHGGRIKLSKISIQNRAKQCVVLVRVDVDGAPHRNPDGAVIPCPHIHLYREGFGDKWAEPLPVAAFKNASDKWELMQDFLKFCNVVQPPLFDRSLIQ